MKNVSEIREQIKSVLSDHCSSAGFDISKSPTFYNRQSDIVRIIHVGFLDARNAAHFNSNTASFTLNLGVFFNSDNRDNLYPKEYEAHIRGTLLRNFPQKHPMNFKGFSLFHPERRRRDIWWVEKDGSNLESLLVNASRIINKNAIKWLDKYSNIGYVINYLKNKREIDPQKSGPFGFGVIGSPCRIDLIAQLENKTKTG